MTCFSSSCRLLLTKKACLIYLSLEARLFRSAQVVWGKRLAWRPIHLIVGLTCVFFFSFFPTRMRVCVCMCVCACACTCWGLFGSHFLATVEASAEPHIWKLGVHFLHLYLANELIYCSVFLPVFSCAPSPLFFFIFPSILWWWGQ